ncbi:MAG: ABC transporter permease [Nonlabens sp.]
MRRVLQILFAATVAFAIVFLLVLSLGRGWSYPQLLPAVLSLDNWRLIFSADHFLFSTIVQSLLISLSVALLATSLAFVTSKTIAYSNNRNKWMLLAYIPYVLSPVILAATLQFYFVYLGASASVVGVMLAQFSIVFPFSVIILSNFWNEKIRSLEQLALTLGSTKAQVLRHVLIPVSKGALLLCFIQAFLVSWFEFGLTNLIGVGSVQTLTIKVFSYVNEANIYNAALASCLLILPPMLLIWVNKRFVFSEEIAV